MVLDEQGSPGSVIATDVSTAPCNEQPAPATSAGSSNGLSGTRRRRYLLGGPDDWEIQPSIRDRVTVQHHNLVTDALPEYLAQCQVVFCRNVLIYFSPEHATAFLTRLAGQLAAGAYLFLGYAETIWQVTDLFQPVRIGDTFEYHRRRDQATPAGSGRPRAAPLMQKPARRPGRSTTRRGPASPGPGGGSRCPADRRQGDSREHRTTHRRGPNRPSGGRRPRLSGRHRRLPQMRLPGARRNPWLTCTSGSPSRHQATTPSAGRAFLAARSALDRCDPTEVVAALGGYRVEELVGLLDSRQAGPCP